MTITLEHQIEFMNQLAVNHEQVVSVIASLKRLQSIEQQEPVGDFSYDKTHGWQQLATHFKGMEIYALPVSQEVLHIPYVDEWKKNVMRLWVFARKHDSDIPDVQLDFMRDYLLAAEASK